MRKLAYFLVVGLLLVNSSCGGSNAGEMKLFPVTGKVTLDGKPLSDCTMILVSTDGNFGSNFAGKLAGDGSYTLYHSDGRPGAEPGKYKVTFAALPPGADAMQKMMTGGGGAPGGPPKAEAVPFPAEYAAASSSPKEVEVKAAPNTIDIVLP